VAIHTLATMFIRRGVRPLLATGALLVVSTTSRAQSAVVAASSSGSKLELRPFLSVYVPIGRQRDLLMNGLGVGTQALWRASRRLAISGTFGWTQTKDRVTPGDRVLDMFQYDVGLEGRVPAWRSGRSWSTGDLWEIAPFVGIGLGGRTSDYRDLDVASMTNFEAYGAAGGEAVMGEAGLRFELRDYVSRYGGIAGGRAGKARTDVALRVGLIVRF
jgi:hypothetical protein